ncbi:MAG TPA: DUF6152 family protein [Steroidobacteraceae bacterium]|jgi:hypothetical protein|nr:DUF6152 family protein [Steroidobacteraceae bacterium]
MARSRARGAAWTCAWYLVFAATTTPALAHHSFAMFDHSHQIKLYGTVARFQWTNPHVYIYLDVDPGPGSATVPVKRYTIECANPGILDRVGWKWNMIKVGDKITTIIAPLRSGQPGGLLKQVMLADGHKFGDGGAAGNAAIE